MDLTRSEIAAVGGDVRLDLRPDRVLITVGDVTRRGLALVDEITALGLPVTPAPGAQAVEIAVDALDIPGVRPFWPAVFGYADHPGIPGNDLVDPLGQGPSVWFQQLDAPRPQRNRIHLDVSVPEDEAEPRIRAALEAGGTLVSDTNAPSWWILADPEGNEVCVCTWQGRDN